MIADDDHVGREHDFRRDLDQHVARAEAEQLPRLSTRDETPTDAQPRQLAPEPEHRHQQPERRSQHADQRERHEPAARHVEDHDDEAEVENRAEQVADVDQVVALLARQEDAEEAEREADHERADGDDDGDLCRAHVLIRDLDREREGPGEHDREQRRHQREDEIDRERRRGQLAGLVASATAALLGGEPDHGRPDSEVEQADEADDRADQRPDAELLGSKRADDDRRDEEAGHDRDGVDAVDQNHIAAKEPHDSVAQALNRRDDCVRPAVDGVAGFDPPP